MDARTGNSATTGTVSASPDAIDCMSAWALLVRELFNAPDYSGSNLSFGYLGEDAVKIAEAHGLVASNGRDPLFPKYKRWMLTQKGIDFCLNRVTQVESKPGGRKWRPTWLSSLPTDIRIGPAVRSADDDHRDQGQAGGSPA